MSRLSSVIRSLTGSLSSIRKAKYSLIFAVFAMFGATGSWGLLASSNEPAIAQAKSAPLTRAAAVQGALRGNAHCRCEITCRAADGRTFTRANSPFPGFTQGLESERNRCQSSCNQWVGSSIQGWAEQENICGALSCSGTSHVGNEARNRWKNVAGAEHQRTCCPPASNGQGCAPGNSQDVISVFRIVQTTDINDPYRLVYTPSQNPAYDASLQAYANYVGSANVRPDVHHIWAGYGLVNTAAPSVLIGWGAVKYIPHIPPMTGPPSFTWGFYSPPPATAPLQVGQTYRVWRGMFFKDAQDRDIAYYGDPGCTLPGFQITISVIGLRPAPGAREVPGLRGGIGRGQVVAIISVAGQPDRIVAIEREDPADRELRLRLERIPPAMQAPRNFNPNAPRRPEGTASPR